MGFVARKFVHVKTGAVLTVNGPRRCAGRYEIIMTIVTASGSRTITLWQGELADNPAERVWEFWRQWHPKPPQSYREIKTRHSKSASDIDGNPLVIPDSDAKPHIASALPGEKVKREYDL